MLRIGIILGSTRPNRRGALVAPWVAEIARQHSLARDVGAQVELIDLADSGLTLLEEPAPAMFGTYQHEHTRRWSRQIDNLDAFVFVTAEYNHSIPAALKNSVDHLFSEWNDKAAGIVSYGVNGGTRAAEHLRQVLAEVKVATVRTQPALSVFEDFVIEDPLAPGQFDPRDMQRAVVEEMLDELGSWASAMQSVRQHSAAPAERPV
jgi:NAD(P)H-dependent FMN reductase